MNGQVLLKDTPLILEWDWERNSNIGINGNSVSIYSNHRAYWVGKCGHNWSAQIASRTKGSGCPYCSGRKVLSGFNDLKTKNPLLASEWDYELNDTTPEKVSEHCHKKYHWICSKCGNKYYSQVKSRAYGSGCPKCGVLKQSETMVNNKIFRGTKTLPEYSPVIASEWDYEKNDKSPGAYLPFSNKKVFWKCPKCGDSYLSAIYARTSNNSGCPNCKMSHGERMIFGYLKRNNIDFSYQHKFSDCCDKSQLIFDFYIPSYNLVIEYDGIQHSRPISYFGGEKTYDGTIRRDKIKDDYCKNRKIHIVRTSENNPDELWRFLDEIGTMKGNQYGRK